MAQPYSYCSISDFSDMHCEIWDNTQVGCTGYTRPVNNQPYTDTHLDKDNTEDRKESVICSYDIILDQKTPDHDITWIMERSKHWNTILPTPTQYPPHLNN